MSACATPPPPSPTARYGKTIAKTNRPQKHHLASRKVIRYILTQLEDIGIVEKLADGGRAITPEGRKDLDTISRAAELDA